MTSNSNSHVSSLSRAQASPFLSPLIYSSTILCQISIINSQLAAMARITPTDLTLQNLSFLPFSPTVFITILAILAVLSTLVLLCGAHRALTSTRGNNLEQKKKKKKNCVRLGGKKPARLHSSKALLMAKLISWRKVQDEEEEKEEEDEDHCDGDEEAIWKRTIIKGEKCRPVDFSGKILYDSNGNMIAAD